MTLLEVGHAFDHYRGEVMEDEHEQTTIRVKSSTKELLFALKILDRESFDSVIKRVVSMHLEDWQDMTPKAQDLLSERLKRLDQAGVYPLSALRDKVAQEKESISDDGLRSKRSGRSTKRSDKGRDK